MLRAEMAATAAELINKSDARLGAVVRNKDGVIRVVCRVGRSEVRINFPPMGKPDIEGSGYSKLLCVKSAREAIENMPESED